MPIVLHNSLTRSREAFAPADPDRVTMYVCGPTVYNHPHIGNARPAVVFDVLVRLLRHHYPRVDYVRNITDVDDKIMAAAASEGVPIAALTARYTEAYRADMAALGVLPPSVEPTVTAHMAEIIAMVGRLVAAGHAYEAAGNVLFHVPSFTGYGALSGRSRDEQIAGARIDVAPYKRDPADFVLWKPSGPDQPGWDSPWGRGRPGWHIECSAMAAAHLGTTMDIHAGGQDLIFPHHENELAQSTCVHAGAPLARFWLHNGFVTMSSEKMSKSLGNVLRVNELLSLAPGEALRWALLSAHYRAPLDWTDELVTQSRRTLDGLYRALAALPAPDPDEAAAPPAAPPEGVLAALEDDLNTPRAEAELIAAARAATQEIDPAARRAGAAALRAGAALLGVLAKDPETWFKGDDDADAAARIEGLIAERRAARARRDFAAADAIRARLLTEGIVLEDKAEGTLWRRAG